jgi:hypothetical protein
MHEQRSVHLSTQTFMTVREEHPTRLQGEDDRISWYDQESLQSLSEQVLEVESSVAEANSM